MDLSTRVRETLASRPSEDAIAFAGTWRSWGWASAAAGEIAHLLRAAGVERGERVALVTRNRPQHAAAVAALIANQQTAVMIYSAQSPTGIAADIVRLGVKAVIADREDWTPQTLAAAREAGAAGIVIEDAHDRAAYAAPGLERCSGESFAPPQPEIAFELLSSGTTGAPKRTSLSWQAASQAVADAAAVYASGSGSREAPAIVVHPIGNVSGITFLVPPLVHGQSIVLLEKFKLDEWVAAIERYKPTRVSIPPIAIGMVLDANIPRSALASLKVVGVGGGKLDVDQQIRFEEVFGIPILPGFGATEFGGVIANWSLDLHRAFGASKRGSVGRARTGVNLRIIDSETGAVAAPGAIGLLEAQVSRIGSDFIRTTDLASLDEDGFLFLHGRADQAINRGGFKVLPESVSAVLRTHPDVADAVVIGMPDARLGEAPVAAIEVMLGANLTVDALNAFAREHLLAYQAPTRFLIMPHLPRTETMKPSLPDIRRLFEEQA